jgi:HSP20 family protein
MMNLIPWRRGRHVPVQNADQRSGDLLSLQQEIERVFDRFWRRPLDLFGDGALESSALLPLVDVRDREDELVITAETPGLSAEDVEVAITDRMLTISGEKKDARESRDGEVYHAERRFGRFSRTIELPPEVDPEAVQASEKNGVLTIRVKKQTPSSSRRVEVETGT